MKVLLINGSPKANGNTALALKEMEKVFLEEGIEVKYLHVGNQLLSGCVACGACRKTGKCAFNDVVNDAAALLEECDVITGYMLYAPATFIIKGSMALLCGFLLKKLQGKKTAYILSALAAECLMVLGYFLYEAIFLGLGFGAAAGILGNAGQGALGAVIFCVLFPVIKKVIGKHL